MLIDQKSSDAQPPPYTSVGNQQAPSQPNDPVASSSLTAAFVVATPPADARRCNMFTASVAHEKIKGAYIVDMSLQIPEAFLAPLAANETVRPNLKLHSEFGRVDAEVWVRNPIEPVTNGDKKQQGPTLTFGSSMGSVHVKLHTLGTQPCQVSVQSSYGSATVTLPHDFVGLLSLQRQYGQIKPLPPRVQVLSDVGGDMKCFVGDLGLIGRDGWDGHTVKAQSPYSKVTVAFIDDVTQASAASPWSWLGLG
ncbi:hypothetical protein BKA62DRAFT_376295 [Auriculariales sp. MPI-PUGE-AT-0066]|nr:hypothetical protein BKA62DRAFT_376295 [Auriculariales sp. MPI-PUGE-AT-0066]